MGSNRVKGGQRGPKGADRTKRGQLGPNRTKWGQTWVTQAKWCQMDVYAKQIRCILELAAPAWQGSITKSEKQDIERIQMSACHIILGQSYTSYFSGLKTLNLETLESRRMRLTLKFALKCEKHPKFKSWFIPSKKVVNTRANPNKYCDVLAKHTRFESSPLSFITKLLNIRHAKR